MAVRITSLDRPIGDTLFLVPLVAIFFSMLIPMFDITVDDAYISFRYASNWSSGEGLLYNVGAAPVEGYTNFLWIVLLAVFAQLPIEIETSAKLLSCAASFGTLIVLWRLPTLHRSIRHASDVIFDSISILLLCGSPAPWLSSSSPETSGSVDCFSRLRCCCSSTSAT